MQNILAADAIASRHQLAEEIRGTLTDVLRTTYRDHADAIIAAWRPGFELQAILDRDGSSMLQREVPFASLEGPDPRAVHAQLGGEVVLRQSGRLSMGALMLA